MNELEFDPQVESEIQNALLARIKGNEGQARVCARRAAGVAVRMFFEQKNFPILHKSGYELLLTLINQPDIPSTARQNAINLTMRVSESYVLPVNIDLVEEARSLCRELAKL